MPSRLYEQVHEFMTTFRHPIKGKPETPPLLRLKLRARLIAEEAIETIEAMCGGEAQVVVSRQELSRLIDEYLPRNHTGPVTVFKAAQALLMAAIDRAKPRVLTLDEMVKVADGTADLDYVTEGARLEFGIDGAPIAELVHAANMAKRGAGEREDGKTLKPEGWKPPDVAIGDELLRQGWSS